MNELFFKTFVITFHKAFLGFFLAVIVIFGVFMEMKQHFMIAERLLQNTIGFYAILLIFLGYAVTQYRFQFRLLNDKRYRIFHFLGFLSFRQLSWNFLPVLLVNHVLILLYAILLSYVGIGINTGGKLVILWIFILWIFFANITLTYSSLKKPFPDYIRVRSRLFKKLNFEFWFLMYLREKKTLLILAVKILSILLLNGFFYFFYSGGYDLRWLEFGLLCASYAHFPFWLEKEAFESQQLTYFHNMPVSYGMKLRRHSTAVVAILLPELVLLVHKYGTIENLSDLFFLLILLISLNMGIYGLIKLRKNQKNALKSAYLVFFLLFLLVIFGVHPAIISASCLISLLIALRSKYSV